MDFKKYVKQNLWESIEKNYESESYSNAILDAMHLLTDTIRNKTGLEGDGASLIGQAFGGEVPKIQLNKLQTESEKNIQKGIQELLRGFYTAIRNPRSHDKSTDTKEDADAIITFIGYLLKMIDNSTSSFEETTFLSRVFEKHYVRDSEYSSLLVNEIPKRQRVNIAISVILKRKTGDIYNLQSFIKALFEKMEEPEVLQVYKVISEELKYTDSPEDIRTILHLISDSNWSKIDKIVKIRIENILYENVKSGEFIKEENLCKSGQLGTWINLNHLLEFENMDKWTSMLVEKLRKNNFEKEYVNEYFWYKLCSANNENVHFSLNKYIKDGLLNNDNEIITTVQSRVVYDENHPWWKIFEDELKMHPQIEFVELPF